MSAEAGRDTVSEQIRAKLAQMRGVENVDFSAYPDSLVVYCDSDGARMVAEESLRELVRQAAGHEPQVRVEISGPGTRSRRARFETIEVTAPQPGQVRARVVLEWQRKRFEGVSEGENSIAGELRACATATVRAVEKVAEGKVTFTLIGAKEVHVFDHDLVAVLLQSPELPDYRLIGTSIIAEDRRRSAALAALSATNRAVGNLVD